MPDSADLRTVRQQYATSANLDARIALHRRFGKANVPLYDWLFDRVQLPARARVLELGCGSGAIWEHLGQRVPADWRLTLTDYSAGMVQTVAEKFRDVRLSFARADAQAVPFADAQFDGVFANHMLYHVPNLDRALGEIRRVLKPGGSLYAATNGETHMQEINALPNVRGRRLFGQLNFRLENGGELLAPHFERVERENLPGALEVTEVEPLMAYIHSATGYAHAPWSAAQDDEIRERISTQITRAGAFHITTAVGLFVATKE